MNKVWFLIFGVCLVLPSCVKDIVLDAGEEPKVVVECVLTEDPVQELYLSYTKRVSQAAADPLLEAEARLVDLDEYNFSVPFSPAGDGRWVLDYAALPGHRYRLEVKVPGHDLITAETKMPEVFWVKHTYYEVINCYLQIGAGSRLCKLDKYGYSGGSFYYNFPDRCWVHFINDDGSIAETICTNFPGVDDFNLTGDTYMSDSVERPAYFNGNRADKPESYPEYADCYLYPVLIGEGLHNSFLRIPKGESISWEVFTTSSIWSVHYPDMRNDISYYDNVSRLSGTYNISGSFETEGTTGSLCFEVLSEEYDQYLAAAMRGAMLEDSTDISRIYLRENILDTNIQGGQGIFGAKKRQLLEWNKWYTSIEYPSI